MKRLSIFNVFLLLIILSAGPAAIAQSQVAQAEQLPVYVPGSAQRPAGNGPVSSMLNLGGRSMVAKNAMTATPANYKTFTRPSKNTSAEAIAANAAYKNHPEVNMLFPGTPCENCYELIDKRTETTKTFVKEGKHKDGSKDMMTQTSNTSMHYRDAQGNWKTIKTQLAPEPGKTGVYAATEQPTPVVINASGAIKYTSLGKAAELVQFNSNLELVYVQPDGTELSLGAANWSNHTAGDEGVYVKNAWPGVDIEMHVYRAAVKTNFLINNPMPQYAAGKLLVRDHMVLANGLSLSAMSGTRQTNGPLQVKDAAGNMKYVLTEASVCAKNDAASLKFLDYTIGNNNVLDIALPGSYLNKPAAAYPVIIDPLFSVATNTVVNGASYNATWAPATGCLYPNAAMTPVNCTITDIQFSFAYTSNIARLYCAFSFNRGACRNPANPALSWSCGAPLGATAGVCNSAGGAAYSIYADLAACLPPPSCASIPLNIDMYFYQNWQATPACVTTYVFGSQPLIITVFGRTVEIGAGGTVSASPGTICSGGTSSLSGTSSFGVPPYTWSWTPGPVAGNPAVVSPANTTVYTGTVTDACGITASANVTVTVNPIAPIAGPASVCAGGSITLTHPTAGTWSSLNTSIATINATTGVMSGLVAGPAVIRFTANTGCFTTATITVAPLPGPATGPTSVCMGTTITLGNPIAGTWASLTPAIATIDANTGVLTGVSAGQAIIQYTTNAGCQGTSTITVTPLPGAITGSTTLCLGATSTLNNTTPGGTWISSNAGIAGINASSGSLLGVAPGNATITYTFGGTCYVTTSVTVHPQEPITGTTTICEGSSTPLSNAVPGGTWSSGNAGVASVDGATSTLYGISGGTANITYVNTFGCTSSLPVTINALPVISSVAFTDPTTCGGTDGSITLSSFSGTSYELNYTLNSAAVPTTTVTPGGSQIQLINLPQGLYNSFVVKDVVTGCISASAGPANLQDPPYPPPPTFTDNMPLCAGQTLELLASDEVPGGTFDWVGPDGLVATTPDVTIVNVQVSASGPYTVTYTLKNCPVSTTRVISVSPPLNLTNVTPDQTITFGSSIQLNAQGALYYEWLPNDGSLSNPNINNPVAIPQDSTRYTVIGTNPAGCLDTAYVTIRVDHNMTEFVPSAFTPNGDGLNDVFRIVNMKYQKLVEFTVYNRWGTLVYQNRYDMKQGWDGVYNGTPQDAGVYNYKIIVTTPEGTTKYYKGDVMLVR